MKISDLYRDIANNPKYKDINALRTITKQLLNRARVRIQTVEGRGAKTSRYIAAVTRLREAGLLTAGGNVSMALPKTDRNKILTTLQNITNFLDVADTTLKGQKRRKREQAAKAKRKKELEKKKREKERLKEKKRKEKEKKEKQSIKERIEKEDETAEEQEQEREQEQEEQEPEYQTDENEIEDSPVIGDYWQIARDAGLFNFVPYDDFAEYIEGVFNNIDIIHFEEIVLDVVEDNGDFWNYMLAYGVDIDD